MIPPPLSNDTLPLRAPSTKMSSASSHSTPIIASSSSSQSLEDEAPSLSISIQSARQLEDDCASLISIPSTTSISFSTDDVEQTLIESLDYENRRGWMCTIAGTELRAHPRAPFNYCEKYKRCGPPTEWRFNKIIAEIGRGVFFVAYTSCDGGDWFYAAPSLIPGAGVGLFTEDDIEASSSPIIYYTGELLDERGVRERYALHDNQSIHEVSSEYLVALSGIYIDASDARISGIARLINHQPSGVANCRINQYGGIVPIKRIPAHTELSFTYHGRWQKFLSASSVSSAAAPAPPGSSNERRK